MAPIDLLHRLKSLYAKEPHQAPTISPQSAVILSIAFTFIYVVPFYLSKTARPSSTLSRDAPSVIKARIRAVTSACICCTLIAVYIISIQARATPAETLHLLGLWPISPVDIGKTLLLLMILFVGPLFEAGVVDSDWRLWIQSSHWREIFSSWIGYRNYVAGPVSEEVLFRSLMIPLHYLAHLSPATIIFTTPLYFGIAHIHHLYEFRITHPEQPWFVGVLRSLFQFTYTSIFGFFAAFLYLRTGSLYAIIVAHSFCNWCGVPRFWGRVGAMPTAPLRPQGRGKEDEDEAKSQPKHQGLAWTVAYYILLVVGAVGFWWFLRPLTESSHALMKF